MGAEVVCMRVPKRTIQAVQKNAQLALLEGMPVGYCWAFSMYFLQQEYQQAKKQAVAYGFIKT